MSNLELKVDPNNASEVQLIKNGRCINLDSHGALQLTITMFKGACPPLDFTKPPYHAVAPREAYEDRFVTDDEALYEERDGYGGKYLLRKYPGYSLLARGEYALFEDQEERAANKMIKSLEDVETYVSVDVSKTKVMIWQQPKTEQIRPRETIVLTVDEVIAAANLQKQTVNPEVFETMYGIALTDPDAIERAWLVVGRELEEEMTDERCTTDRRVMRARLDAIKGEFGSLFVRPWEPDYEAPNFGL